MSEPVIPRGKRPAAPSRTESFYRLTDGYIGGSHTSAPGFAPSVPGTGVIAGKYDGAASYVDLSSVAPIVRDRPVMPITLDTAVIPADGSTEATFAGVPAGAVLTIDGANPQPITDGTAEISLTVRGSYAIRFVLWPYQDWVGTLGGSRP